MAPVFDMACTRRRSFSFPLPVGAGKTVSTTGIMAAILASSDWWVAWKVRDRITMIRADG